MALQVELKATRAARSLSRTLDLGDNVNIVIPTSLTLRHSLYRHGSACTHSEDAPMVVLVTLAS